MFCELEDQTGQKWSQNRKTRAQKSKDLHFRDFRATNFVGAFRATNFVVDFRATNFVGDFRATNFVGDFRATNFLGHFQSP